MSRARREAEGVVQEGKTREREMQELRLEVEELEKGVAAQQQQVSGHMGYRCVVGSPCLINTF